jgi:1-acyl-sn-glycerol-3-phosphate acyltransferase
MQFEPPSGYPLGTNKTFKHAAAALVPILKILTKREWRGAENLPKSGPVIVISNHLSYADALVFAHFLYGNGRAVRYLGKDSVFRIPILGKIILSAGQIPVARESDKASHALDSALGLLLAGHCVGIYPEGTLTRDPKLWPMVAKTGIARLAILSKAPVIPIAQWGDQNLLAPYSKKLVFWKRTKISYLAGPALDFSKWYGKEEDQAALIEATSYAMAEITKLLEQIRGESAPDEIFDPHHSNLPRTGNFKKSKKKAKD